MAETVQQDRDLSNRKLAQNQRELSQQIESVRNDLKALAEQVQATIELQRRQSGKEKE